MQPRWQRLAHHRAEAESHPALIGSDDREATQANEDADPEDRQWRDSTAEQLIEPAARHLDAELVTDRLRHDATKRFRRRQQTKHAAVERRTRNLARHPGPV